MIRRRLAGEEGWTLVTAVLLMSMMLGLSLATYSVVDTQQRQSADTRKRETAFNVAEAALNAQIYALSREWPGQGYATDPFQPCTQASTGTRCPSSQTLADLFNPSPDTTGALSWRTEVHDNDAPVPQFYSETTTRARPGYDANGDGRLWVRAQATTRGKTRTLIALVRTQEQAEALPRAALITGRLDISNLGQKTIIDATGGSSASGLVAVRCTPTVSEPRPCLGHPLGGGSLSTELASLNALLDFQINPNVTQTGYSPAPALKTEEIDRLRKRARSDGKYYATCPPNALPPGYVIFIESGNCSYQSNTDVNSPSSPGFVLLAKGTLRLDGTQRYYGVIYAANQLGLSSTLVEVAGNVQVQGGILVDGADALTIAGSSKLNIQLDVNAFNAVRSYGAAGIIQNTFREIKGA